MARCAITSGAKRVERRMGDAESRTRPRRGTKRSRPGLARRRCAGHRHPRQDRAGYPVEAQPRTLAVVAPEEVLRHVRARAKAGKPMTQAAVHGLRLSTLCSYHFGGWYQAVEAAGLRPLGQARSATTRPAGPRPLTEALLRSDKPALELKRLTAVPRETIRFRRAKLGIVRRERRRREDMIGPVRSLLGRLPDSEVARRAGLSPSTLFKARQQLAIPGRRCRRRRPAASCASGCR